MAKLLDDPSRAATATDQYIDYGRDTAQMPFVPAQEDAGDEDEDTLWDQLFPFFLVTLGMTTLLLAAAAVFAVI